MTSCVSRIATDAPELAAFGGQLLQAELAGQELFYRSPWPALPGAALRGGVPVLFPQFAGNGPLPKHGFARNRDWVVTRRTADCCEAQLELRPEPGWPHAARLRLVVATAEALVVTLSIENVGASVFAFSGGLHPYWRVHDIRACEVEGLALEGLGLRVVDEWHAVTTPLLLTDGARRVRLTQSGFDGWQAWNPGEAHALPDLPPEDWCRFLCLEPIVMVPRTLLPGEGFTGELRACLV